MHSSIFALALINSALLIAIFIARKIAPPQRTAKGHATTRMDMVSVLGYMYLTLAIPAAATLAIYPMPTVYTIFLIIFLAYLVLECLFDFVLKVDFRRSWKLLVPYLALYYAMNYGFFVMTYRGSATNGIIVLILTLLQVAVNLWSHRPWRKMRQPE
jgi:hypothetical protein